jgi:hypothetical protein
MAFQLTSLVSINSELTNPIDLSTPSSLLNFARQMNFSQGAAAGQADMIWHDRRTIAASSTDSLDLTGSLVGPFGGTALTFARIKMLAVAPLAANTNNINLQRPSASTGVPLFLAAAGGIVLKPGGLFLWYDPTAAGVVVTPSTGDIIEVVNAAAGTSVDYDIVIVGASS